MINAGISRKNATMDLLPQTMATSLPLTLQSLFLALVKLRVHLQLVPHMSAFLTLPQTNLRRRDSDASEEENSKDPHPIPPLDLYFLLRIVNCCQTQQIRDHPLSPNRRSQARKGIESLKKKETTALLITRRRDEKFRMTNYLTLTTKRFQILKNSTAPCLPLVLRKTKLALSPLAQAAFSCASSPKKKTLTLLVDKNRMARVILTPC